MLNHFRLLAQYNQLMNQRQYAAAARLSNEQRDQNKKAFFKSITGTLNHILVGDLVWLNRFAKHPSGEISLSGLAGYPRPMSLDQKFYDDFDTLRSKRDMLDEMIIAWIENLIPDHLNENFHYTNTHGIKHCKPFDGLILHLFLHQVHHRGQVTTLLYQFDVDFGETDLIEIIS